MSMAAVSSSMSEAAAKGDRQLAPPAGKGTGKGKRRLSETEVQWILSRERREFAPHTSDCTPDLRRGMEAFKVLRDSFAEFHDEVRAEYEAKSYVEVDDDEESFQHREEVRRSMRGELADLFDGIDLSGVTFSDRYYEVDESEGDEHVHYKFEGDDEDESGGEEEDGDEQAGAEESSAQVPKETRLPDEEVKWILARKREYPPSRMFTAEEMEAHNKSDCFTEYQDWVREQYDADGGVVVLDDELLEQMLKNEQMVQDMIDEMDDFSVADLGVETSDRYSDFYDSEEEEDENEKEKRRRSNKAK